MDDELDRKQAKWLNTRNAANYLGGSRRALEKLRELGLHRCRLGGTFFYDREEIDKLLESRKI